MKRALKRKKTTLLILAIVLTVVVVGLLAVTAGNQRTEPVSDFTGDTTGGMPSETTSSEKTSSPSAATSDPSGEPAISGGSDESEGSEEPSDDPIPSAPEASDPGTTTTEPDESVPPAVSTEPEEPTVSETTSKPEESTPPTPPPPPPPDGEYTGVVYLTFDDGPSKLTSEVLDILKEYDAKATFFVVGVAEGNEWKYDLMKRALNEGHQIAMHGNSHEYEDIYKSVETATDNFFKENRKLQEVLGIDVKVIRFPGGSSNTVSMKYCKNVMTNAAKILLENGYTYFDWDVSSGDAGEYRTSSDGIYKKVISGVGPSKPNVILMHDGNGHQATVDALPKILKWLKDAGYKFEVITESTPPVRHSIAN